jgi:hypothetical protein
MLVVNGGPSRCLVSFTKLPAMARFIFKINIQKINKMWHTISLERNFTFIWLQPQYASLVAVCRRLTYVSVYLLGLRFSQWCLWRVISSEMWRQVVWWKHIFFWITTPRSSKIVRRFSRTYRLHLQALIVSRVGNQHKHEANSASSIFLLLLFLCPEDGGDMILRNVRLSPNYAVLQPRQSYYLYVVTAVMTSNWTITDSNDLLLNNPKDINNPKL